MWYSYCTETWEPAVDLGRNRAKTTTQRTRKHSSRVRTARLPTVWEGRCTRGAPGRRSLYSEVQVEKVWTRPGSHCMVRSTCIVGNGHMGPLPLRVLVVRHDWKHYLSLTSLAGGDKAGTLDTNRTATRILSVFTCKPPVRFLFHDAKHNGTGMGCTHRAKAMVVHCNWCGSFTQSQSNVSTL